MKIDTILFDLHGTLLNCSGAQKKAWELALGKNCSKRSMEIVRFHLLNGASSWEIARHLSFDVPAQHQLVERKRIYFGSLELDVRLAPYCRRVLTQMTRRFNLGVVSLGETQASIRVLSTKGIDHYFRYIGGRNSSEETTKTLLIERAMNNLGVKNHQCMYVGDTKADEHAARHLDLKYFHVQHNLSASSLHALASSI